MPKLEAFERSLLTIGSVGGLVCVAVHLVSVVVGMVPTNVAAVVLVFACTFIGAIAAAFFWGIADRSGFMKPAPFLSWWGLFMFTLPAFLGTFFESAAIGLGLSVDKVHYLTTTGQTATLVVFVWCFFGLELMFAVVNRLMSVLKFD